MPGELTQLLNAMHSGDPKAADRLLPLVYDELLAIHEALDRLEKVDADAARLVKLRYFVGMNMEQTAEDTKWDPSDSRNQGVLFNQRVRSRQGHLLRWIEYLNPENAHNPRVPDQREGFAAGRAGRTVSTALGGGEGL